PANAPHREARRKDVAFRDFSTLSNYQPVTLFIYRKDDSGLPKIVTPGEKMTILIFGGPDDAHAVHIHTRLRERGADVEFFDGRDFPARLGISFYPQHGGSIRLSTGRRLTFDQIHAVYWRNYNNVRPPPLADPEQTFIAANDARALFESVLIHLPAR